MVEISYRSRISLNSGQAGVMMNCVNNLFAGFMSRQHVN